MSGSFARAQTHARAALAVVHTPALEVTWEESAVTTEERWRALGHRGTTVWMTGLPASGKSTLAGAVERDLVKRRVPAIRLDGDNLRHGLNRDLGFDAASRAENVRRTAHAAALLAQSGVLALVSLVSPYAADRALARQIHEQAGVPFVEVFLDTPLALCERRDPKLLYARARRGELVGLTGVDAPYERPSAPELALEPAPIGELVQAVLGAISVTQARDQSNAAGRAGGGARKLAK
jgi:bifunctional enzyme CysN/CysC